jgi:hypothetical protein
LLWFPVAYVVRFVFYLIVEPQVNPIKHFPVVTVSHKVLAPLFPTVAQVLNVSEGTAILIIAGIPGVFGFIAWELLANWRLYAANRAKELGPVPIGHHGETGRGLLRPGFHSGTIPKLYRRLRAGWLDGTSRADQHADVCHDLHHIETALHRLCERELFPLWAAAGVTASLSPAVARVELGCQSISLAIRFSEADPRTVALLCRHRNGVIFGTVDLARAAHVGEEQRGVIDIGLDGLLIKLAAGVERHLTWDEWVAYWSKRGTDGR